MSSSARRDSGLERVNTLTRWATFASLAAVGVVAGVVAHAIPGHSKASTSSSSNQPVTGSSAQPSTPAYSYGDGYRHGDDGGGFGGSSFGGSSSSGSATTPSGGGLSAPVQAPSRSFGGGVVSSGAS